MKFTIRPLRPRNPLVVPVRARRAGRHERNPSALRQQERSALRRELDRLKPSL